MSGVSAVCEGPGSVLLWQNYSIRMSKPSAGKSRGLLNSMKLLFDGIMISDDWPLGLKVNQPILPTTALTITAISLSQPPLSAFPPFSTTPAGA